MGISSFEVGCRVHCDGEYGTVLYVGPIEGIDGTWLGVEWDNISRGKHSGCYNNKTYFKTKNPNSGSFIRLSKSDIGISCPNAIKMKYGHENSSNPPNFINLPQKCGPERHIEMVGMKKIMGKQSNFLCLTDVVLSGMLVKDHGNDNELKELIPNVKHLDLSQNLLSSWETINEIVRQLDHLTTLILSKNRIGIPNVQECQDCYASLKALILNYMSYSWNEILDCATLWPYIEELSVQDNRISILEAPPHPIFSNIKFLSLDNNPIQSWSEVCKLGKLSSLKELHLENTNLESIIFPDASPLEKTKLFSSLEILFLRNNNLKQWQDISELNKLERLNNLMINNNPVFLLENPETARQFIIAKIQNLKTLNRVQLERAERRGAEFDYIKKFYKDWLLDDNSKNVIQMRSSPFLILHPTFPNLLQKHGAPDQSEIETRSTLIKDNLISVQFFTPQFPDKPSITKKLPGEMTVGKLKALAKRIFKVPASEVTLTLLFNIDQAQKTVLDNNLRQLSFYSIYEKDKIAVEW